MPAQLPLRVFQFGRESTAGTIVAATNRYVGLGIYNPHIDRYFPDFPRGVRAPVTGGGFQRMKGSTLDVTTEATFEELEMLFNTSLALESNSGGGDPYTHTFTLGNTVLAAAPTVLTVSTEFVIADGTTNFYIKKFGFGMTESWDLDYTFNQDVKLKYKLFGRAEQTLSSLAAVAVLANREPLMANATKFYIDNSWANLGTTQWSTTVRSIKVTFTSGLMPDYTLDGRTDTDMTTYLWGMPKVKIVIVAEHAANAQAEFALWRTAGQGPLRFIRILTNSISSGVHSLQLDIAAKHVVDPKFSEQNKTELVTFEYESEYDATGTNMMVATLKNAIAAFT